MMKKMENLSLRRCLIKMPKCPKCKKEIEDLDFSGTAVVFMRFYLAQGRYPEYDERETEFKGNDDEYFCPECEKKLFNTEEEAIKFLKK